jgi:hypothetical protein
MAFKKKSHKEPDADDRGGKSDKDADDKGKGKKVPFWMKFKKGKKGGKKGSGDKKAGKKMGTK